MWCSKKEKVSWKHCFPTKEIRFILSSFSFSLSWDGEAIHRKFRNSKQSHKKINEMQTQVSETVLVIETFYLCIRFPKGNMWVKAAHHSRSRNNTSMNVLFYVTFEITSISDLYLASKFTNWQNRGKLKGHLSRVCVCVCVCLQLHTWV